MAPLLLILGRVNRILNCPLGRPDSMGPCELSDALEEGKVVHFPRSPVPFPTEIDLRFLRDELPGTLRKKNASYHPEVDRVVGVGGPRGLRDRARRILMQHNILVVEFLKQAIPSLARNWGVATASFRPLEERGRGLPAHASNERIHVDAGAYGATHGARILRFFMNANPEEDRVWVSKGTFPEVHRRYAASAGISPPQDLDERWGDRTRHRMVRGLSRAGLRMARLLDTSPYDRLMRRFHNFMKDSREFQETPEGHAEFAFPPFSAWMVFTDMVTHGVVSGRHAFIDTFIIPLENCRHPELSPYRILRGIPDRRGN